MKYSVVYIPEEDYITLTVQGLTDLGSMPDMLSALADLVEAINCFDILIDVRNAKVNLSLLELLTLIGMIESLSAVRSIELRSLRRAMVSQRSPGMMEVYEKLVYYLGGDFRIFHTLEEAKIWLKSLPVV